MHRFFLRSLALLAFILIAGSALASTQNYVFEIRNNGAPATGLAGTLTATYYNATTGATVASPAGLTLAEYGATGRYVIRYDPDNAALVALIDAGGSIANANERYLTLHLTADPSLTANLGGLTPGRAANLDRLDMNVSAAVPDAKLSAAVTVATSATTFSTSLAGQTANGYKGNFLTFVTGPNAGLGVYATVQSYAVSGGVVTLLSALPNAPRVGDVFTLSVGIAPKQVDALVAGSTGPTTAQIAAAVWDWDVATDNPTGSQAGALLWYAGDYVSPASIYTVASSAAPTTTTLAVDGTGLPNGFYRGYEIFIADTTEKRYITGCLVASNVATLTFTPPLSTAPVAGHTIYLRPAAQPFLVAGEVNDLAFRNLKSYVHAKSGTTQIVDYFVPGTSDSAAQNDTGTVFFHSVVHYNSDGTIFYTTYN